MLTSQDHVSPATSMGATLIDGGATFRVWAPSAHHVYVVFGGKTDIVPEETDASGHWTGFIPGVTDGRKYRFWIAGDGGAGFQPPPFNDLIVYQFHFGTFYAKDASGNAIQPLPVVEHPGEWSLGYNGTDLFSPEMDYCVDPDELSPYLARVNQLLVDKSCPPLTIMRLGSQINQLKVFIDICHLYGLAVLADLVYNHAGSGLDAQSIDHIDMPASPDKHNSIYFSARDWAGGRMFAFQKEEVQGFQIDNVKMFVDEYHVDGFRFDEVSGIDDDGGWFFAQQLTDTLRYHNPRNVQIAEYWKDHRWLAITRPPQGMGFDIGYADGIRDQVRSVISQAAAGSEANVELGRLKDALYRPVNFTAAWQAYNCLENHDFVLDADGEHHKPRMSKLADGDNPRSWFARSRSRVATGLLLTAPGVPMVFMGQEIMEDKLWSDDPSKSDDFIWWDGFESENPDPHMVNHHRFTRDLMWLRRHHPALRGENVNVFHLDEANRVLAYHCWVQGNPGGVLADGSATAAFAHSAGMTLPANSVLVFSRDWGD